MHGRPTNNINGHIYPKTKKRKFRNSVPKLFILASALIQTSISNDTHCQAFSLCTELRRSSKRNRNRILIGTSSRRDAGIVTESDASATIDLDDNAPTTGSNSKSRRGMLVSIAASALCLPSMAAQATSSDQLENLSLGSGRWNQLDRRRTASKTGTINASFCTYTARFLIHYDQGVSQWWKSIEKSCSLLSEDQRRIKYGRSFGSLAKSIELALLELQERQQLSNKECYAQLWDLFQNRYGNKADAKRHIALLFAVLPGDQQPVECMRQVGTKESEQNLGRRFEIANPPPSILLEDMTALLPAEFRCAFIPSSSSYIINPPVSLFEIGVDEEFGQTATGTAFGPLASQPLERELPEYSLDIYALFGISGAACAALTHAAVIPLDVVKTRAQTDPDQYGDIIKGTALVFEKEGFEGFLIGAQATIVGFFWYGLSVYPSYTFFKRFISLGVLPVEVATVHANDIALVAGALASVIASLGLTPLEAARIRVVADPDKYKPLGLLGTLDFINKEDPALGWKNLYAGLPSLLTRQVIFGSVKFLAFERACELIFMSFPGLRDATWTSLTVSLVAGGISGALSSVVSQPADSVLTYVAKNNQGSLGVLEGSRIMVEKEGIGSLFRGVGSRSVWAGFIIGGQFLLYDIFRTAFGVNAEDLKQIYQIILPVTSS